MSPMNRIESRRNILPVVICIMLLCLYGVLSYTSTLGKNATVDEPTHAVGAYMTRWYSDYRIDVSNPPLWSRWVALALPRQSLQVDLATPAWPMLLKSVADSPQWYVPILYRTPSNDPDRFIDHARRMTVFISIALAALTAWWAWRLAGPIAGIAATIIFTFDPNFLAQGSLVLNDIAEALFWTALCGAVWLLGQRVTLLRAGIVACMLGAAIATKFSGLLAVPLLLVLLVIRALLPTPWPIFRHEAKSLWPKLGIVTTVSLAAALFSWAIIWASYGFQFSVNPDPSQRFDMSALVNFTAKNQILARDRYHSPTTAEVDSEPKDALVASALWADQKHFLPEPCVAGLIYLDGFNKLRPAFLLEERRMTGWWYYFLLAGLFKTPISSPVAATLAAVVLITGRFISKPLAADEARLDFWAVCCLLVPPIFFGIAAMASAQNVGIRHVFPMAPPIFILIGIATARAFRRSRRLTIVVASLIALALVIESTSMFPDYLSFFNVAAGGARGGLHLLADSNLDLGQDLKGLATWRKNHPDGQLDLDYLGMPDPKYYLHNDYVSFEEALRTDPHWADRSGYLAVSATHLQGLYLPAQVADFFRGFTQFSPVAVIGGSIYVYRLPLMDNPKQ
jgi:hypothetical protein